MQTRMFAVTTFRQQHEFFVTFRSRGTLSGPKRGTARWLLYELSTPNIIFFKFKLHEYTGEIYLHKKDYLKLV